MPIYDGETPTRAGGTFTGWTPEVSEVTGNITYTAEYAMSYIINDELILEDENCVFTITQIEDGLLGTKIYLSFENKTTDKDLMFTWDNVSVNGYMVSAYFAEEVTAGNKANDTVTIYDLEEINISSIDLLEFNLRVYDSNNWSADDLVDSVFKVYPTGISPLEIAIPERKTTEDEIVFFDNEVGAFVILAYEVSASGEIKLEYYIENRHDVNLMFTWRDVSVNNYMFDIYFAKSLISGRRAYGSITFYDYKLNQNSITSIDEIEFELKVYDYNDWLSDPLLKTVFTYNPEE